MNKKIITLLTFITMLSMATTAHSMKRIAPDQNPEERTFKENAQKFYVCQGCGKKYIKKSGLNDHWMYICLKNPDRTVLTCQYCHKLNFAASHVLSSHEKFCKDNPDIIKRKLEKETQRAIKPSLQKTSLQAFLDLCESKSPEQQTIYKQPLSMPRKSHQHFNNFTSCPYCNNTYQTKDSCRKHSRHCKKNPNAEILICIYCHTSGFSAHRHLKRHVRTCEKNPNK